MEQQDRPSTLPSVPSISDFTPLSDHESSTPLSFFDGKPVLHAAISVCDLLISSKDIHQFQIFGDLLCYNLADEASSIAISSNPSNINGMAVFGGIDGYITSNSVILYHAEKQGSKAISIPYPNISLHATQRLFRTLSGSNDVHQYSALPSSESGVASSGHETAAIYLQLDMDPLAREHRNADEDEDEEGEESTVEVFLVPQPDLLAQKNGGENSSPAATQDVNDGKVKEIFEALSSCADLHPDTSFGENEGGGGLASMFGFGGGGGGSMPGHGGWITSENAHEFEGEFGVDGEEDGGDLLADENEGELGPGAGIRRPRQESDVDGHALSNLPDEENGRHNEDTKWQRTG